MAIGMKKRGLGEPDRRSVQHSRRTGDGSMCKLYTLSAVAICMLSPTSPTSELLISSFYRALFSLIFAHKLFLGLAAFSFGENSNHLNRMSWLSSDFFPTFVFDYVWLHWLAFPVVHASSNSLRLVFSVHSEESRRRTSSALDTSDIITEFGGQ